MARSNKPYEWLINNIHNCTNECLIWPFTKDRHGRGRITINNKRQQTHRFVCRMFHGEPPTEEYEAAHNCGQGHNACINPNHLRWATKLENQADKLIHGTHHKGLNNQAAKVTKELANEIFKKRQETSWSIDKLGKLFNLSPMTIYLIISKKHWTMK